MTSLSIATVLNFFHLKKDTSSLAGLHYFYAVFGNRPSRSHRPKFTPDKNQTSSFKFEIDYTLIEWAYGTFFVMKIHLGE